LPPVVLGSGIFRHKRTAKSRAKTTPSMKWIKKPAPHDAAEFVPMSLARSAVSFRTRVPVNCGQLICGRWAMWAKPRLRQVRVSALLPLPEALPCVPPLKLAAFLQQLSLRSASLTHLTH
jgi:hypothetical protein